MIAYLFQTSVELPGRGPGDALGLAGSPRIGLHLAVHLRTTRPASTSTDSIENKLHTVHWLLAGAGGVDDSDVWSRGVSVDPD